MSRNLSPMIWLRKNKTSEPWGFVGKVDKERVSVVMGERVVKVKLRVGVYLWF